jgi:hypothetical protein
MQQSQQAFSSYSLSIVKEDVNVDRPVESRVTEASGSVGFFDPDRPLALDFPWLARLLA